MNADTKSVKNNILPINMNTEYSYLHWVFIYTLSILNIITKIKQCSAKHVQ